MRVRGGDRVERAAWQALTVDELELIDTTCKTPPHFAKTVIFRLVDEETLKYSNCSGTSNKSSTRDHVKKINPEILN